VHGALVLRILAQAWLRSPERCTLVALSSRCAVLRGGPRMADFGPGTGPGCGNPNRRTARTLDVCLRPQSRLRGEEVREIDEAQEDHSVCRQQRANAIGT